MPPVVRAGAVSRGSGLPWQPRLSLLPTSSLYSPVRNHMWFPNKPVSLITPSLYQALLSETHSLPLPEPTSLSVDPIYC